METPVFPSYVALCFVYKIGVDFETKNSSGYLNWLKYSLLNSLHQRPEININSQVTLETDNLNIQVILQSD